MGSKSTKSTVPNTTLSEEDISKLIKSTSFDRSRILQFHAQFIVSNAHSLTKFDFFHYLLFHQIHKEDYPKGMKITSKTKSSVFYYF